MAPFYATAKHGVVGLVRSLAKPLGLEGIQINGLAPAVVGALNPCFLFSCSLHCN
jgi:NAD(P)-dependent dehydrogenase (short-subunit alcohol dehydrogenase family)